MNICERKEVLQNVANNLTDLNACLAVHTIKDFAQIFNYLLETYKGKKFILTVMDEREPTGEFFIRHDTFLKLYDTVQEHAALLVQSQVRFCDSRVFCKLFSNASGVVLIDKKRYEYGGNYKHENLTEDERYGYNWYKYEIHLCF